MLKLAAKWDSMFIFPPGHILCLHCELVRGAPVPEVGLLISDKILVGNYLLSDRIWKL